MNDTVDWSKVKTERRAEEDAIRKHARELEMSLRGFVEGLEGLAEKPADLSSADTVECLEELASGLSRLASLFHAHLNAVDLDDSCKAIGVSGGSINYPK